MLGSTVRRSKSTPFVRSKWLEARVERAKEKEQMVTKEAKEGRARPQAPPFVQIVARKVTL